MGNTFANNPTGCIPIVAFDLSGKYVAHFDDFDVAELKLALAQRSISAFFSGRINRCHKYIFVKQSDYKEGMKVTYAGIKKKRKFLSGK